MAQRIEICRTGKHRATNGKVYEITLDALREAAQVYSPEFHEAPAVIGHPADNAPAYGWVKGLDVLELGEKDGILRAEFHQLNPDFAEGVTGGAYKKRSSSFYEPAHPSNPVPGKLYLRHVGFLGAVPPAVKGLRDVACFADAEDEAQSLTLEFADWSDRMVARMFRGLREFLIGEFGQEKADLALPPWQVDEVQDNAVADLARPESATAFAEGDVPTETSEGAASDETASQVQQAAPAATSSMQGGAVAAQRAHNPEVAGSTPAPATTNKEGEPGEASPTAPSSAAGATGSGASAVGQAPGSASDSEPTTRREDELTERERELQRREAELAQRELERTHAAHVAFCEGLQRDGRPLPCDAGQLVAFMHRLEGVESPEFISFGEGDARTQLEFFVEEILAKLPQSVEFRELSRSTEFAETEESIQERAVRIRAHQAAAERDGRFITTAQAAQELG